MIWDFENPIDLSEANYIVLAFSAAGDDSAVSAKGPITS